jgi:hypothetical protein
MWIGGLVELHWQWLFLDDYWCSDGSVGAAKFLCALQK